MTIETSAAEKIEDEEGETPNPNLPTNPGAMQDCLEDAIRAYCDSEGIAAGSIVTFGDFGLRGFGLCVTLGDSEFQLVVRGS